MTETHQTPDSIRYAWRRALNRDYRLTEADRRVLLELESYANPDGTNAHPGNERIAAHLATGPGGDHISLSSVERALRAGRKLGYILQTKKGGRRKTGGEVVKAASVWRLTMPAPVEATSPVTQMTGDSEDGDGITRQTTPHHPSIEATPPVRAMTGYQSLNHQSNSRDRSSTGAQARRPEKMSSDWMPAETHRRIAAEAGVNLEAAVQAMREWSYDYGKRAASWDKTLGAWIKACRAGDGAGGRWDGMDYAGVLIRRIAAEAPSGATQVAPETVEARGGGYTPSAVVEVELVEGTARRWTWTSDPAVFPAPADLEADRAEVAALVEAYEAPRAAEVEAQRRGHIARKVATKLGGIRERERSAVADGIDAGETVDDIVDAIQAARRDAKHRAMVELARAAGRVA
ncbi:hypothetical protein EV641_106199 [Rhodococcus sp. SMB37]|uniref:helix-turn-helix domain-containing protein n=1 Tax=Rhodococcus sp. SMB37 TaxID=2512213 RepID=UPI00104C1131|nr:helix-turn-helix domain-containing protein [Rhodococcus sp. SMB37]TCN53553.1 hypothetical protein EV641_106199 [Rhodococcus sp. SMB37]